MFIWQRMFSLKEITKTLLREHRKHKKKHSVKISKSYFATLFTARIQIIKSQTSENSFMTSSVNNKSVSLLK